MKKASFILSHIVFWMFTFLAIPTIFGNYYTELCFRFQYPNGHPFRQAYVIEDDYRATVAIFLIGLCIFYASYFSFNFFVKRPLLLILNLAFYVVYTMVFSLPADLIDFSVAFKLGPVLYFNVFGFLASALTEWLKDRKIKAELEKDKLNSQLELLKLKIDPHFLFNNLNNVDVFIQEDPAKASEYLKKLSDILRFMLYESGADRIPLSTEIEYIRKYIDLQKIRTANQNFVSLEITGDPAGKEIAPMIFIHFIENAFKYASNKKIEEAVTVKMNILSDKVQFRCKNHIAVNAYNGDKKGLGIQLMRQKLDLLFKKRYKLNITEENNWYLVELEIQLNEN